MAKKKWLILVLVLLIVVIVFAVCRLTTKEVIYLEEPDAFYPKFYDFVIARFADSTEEINVGPVKDYKDAARKGLRLLKKENKENQGRWNRWLRQSESITVFYVPEEDTWVWEGSCPCVLKEGDPHWAGCHPVMIIRSDGTVVAKGSY